LGNTNPDIKPNQTAYEVIEAQMVSWAKKQTGIRAVVVSGSQARTDHPADEWSDLDLVIFEYPSVESTVQRQWISSITSEIGEIWLVVFDKSETKHPNWVPLMTFLTGRIQVDVLLVTVQGSDFPSMSLMEIFAKSQYPYVFSSGVRVLYDRYPLPGELCLPETPNNLPNNPSETEFNNTLSMAWLQAIQVIHYFRRGEIWRADQTFHCKLKKNLLRIIEWHARVKNRAGYKIWPRGRFLEEWADKRIVEELRNFTGALEPGVLSWSVSQICDLLAWVGNEIASEMGYSYPNETEKRVRDWLEDISM